MGMKSTVFRAGLETLYFSGAHRWLGPHVNGVGAILMLHHVRPPRRDRFQPNAPLEVTPQHLARVVRWLRDSEIDIISLDEMHRRLTERDFARRFACFTFDDGYRDNREFAYPILKAANAPFAIYVASSFPDRLGKLWWLALEEVVANNTRLRLEMDGRERWIECEDVAAKREAFDLLYWWLRGLPTEQMIMDIVWELAARYGIDADRYCAELCMDWNELAEFAQDPLLTIGAHTVNHVMLAKASDGQARSELKMSRSVIASALGKTPEHFAYPYGDRATVGPRDFRIASELGYKTAVTTRPGVLFPEHAQHFTALPRISLNGAYQSARFIPVLVSGTATALWNGFRRVDAA